MSSSLGTGFIFSPEFRADPYPFYRQFRSIDPMLWAPEVLGRGGWLITGHAEASFLLKDNRLGKEVHKLPGTDNIPHIPLVTPVRSSFPSMLFLDPPAHTRLRSLVNLAFTPRMVERLRPHIQQIANNLIDLFQSDVIDLVEQYAFVLPVTVICEMLGIPPEDRHAFRGWTSALAQSLSASRTPEQLKQADEATLALNSYFQEKIAERRNDPREDLITALIQAHDQGDSLNTTELVSMLRLLLIAGHETTVNLITMGTMNLLRNPDQLSLVTGQPALLPAAVDELLRYDSPVQMTMRIAFEEVQLGRHTIHVGDLVVILLGGANRDPAHFPDPDRLDITRANANTHLSFAQGVHYCLGAPLARMEGQIAIGTLLRRLPNLELAAEPTWRENLTLRGPESLQLRIR